jgi:hypothetical protein
MLSNPVCTHPPVEFNNKINLLFIVLGTFFIANVLIAEFIGVKVFSLEKTLGFDPLNFNILGTFNLSFNLTAGALLWPAVFVMTDIINEYFGTKGVRLLSYIAVGLICYAFLMIFFAIKLTPADFWIIRTSTYGTVNMEVAFQAIFGQGLWIIIGSLVAFLVSQLIDVSVFHQVKKYTGESYLWLRATGSTLVSQFIDSFIVLIIAFHLNPSTNWDLKLVLIMGMVKYFYKFVMALALTPVIYFVHVLIDRYLGEPLATYLKQQAMKERTKHLI